MEDFMALIALRVFTALIGLSLITTGIGWWIQPEQIADILKVSLIFGEDKSPQIAHSGSFFISSGAIILWGAIVSNEKLLLAGALLIAMVIPGRFFSTLIHGGVWTPNEVIIETIIVCILLVTAKMVHSRANQAILD